MRRIVMVLVAASVMAFAQNAMALDKVVERVTKACEMEIKNYCSQVKMGQGRMLSCFYAHEDKLTVKCINALYDGLHTLERAVEAISYVANQCSQDIDKHCGSTVPGEGRIAQCLLNKKSELSERCSGAIDEVGLQTK